MNLWLTTRDENGGKRYFHISRFLNLSLEDMGDDIASHFQRCAGIRRADADVAATWIQAVELPTASALVSDQG
jgi:hypothetical protein